MTQTEALRLALETLEYAGPSWIEARQPAITAIKAALEAKDEPDHSDELTIAYMSGLHRGKEVAQRTWVGLTDKEVTWLCNTAKSHEQTWGMFVRTIETKLKEKNT